jgi:hypothetical protein
MFKPKTTIAGRLENSSGGAIRTHDLQVTPYHIRCGMSNAPKSVPHRPSSSGFVRRVL